MHVCVYSLPHHKLLLFCTNAHPSRALLQNSPDMHAHTGSANSKNCGIRLLHAHMQILADLHKDMTVTEEREKMILIKARTSYKSTSSCSV
jgi:hypothetical protein